ncbi:MAG TPA: efflux RND transporter periplasmic adaptor subunit [Candidatus Paceibacterota bacterium]
MITFLTNKRKVYGIAILIAALIAGFFFFLGNGNHIEEILVVRPGEFIQQVSVSGKVVAAESVDLAFSQAGRVSAVYAKVGDIVPAGTILASIENGDARAEIFQKEAAFSAASAKLKSLKSGTRPEQIAVTQSSVASAEATLAQANQALVDTIRNAYTQSDDAVRRRVDQFMSNPQSSSPQLNFIVSNQLKLDVEWGRFLAESMLSGWKTSVDSLNVSSDLETSRATAIQNLDRMRSFLEKVASALNAVSPSSTLSQTTIDGYRADVTTARTNVNTAVTSLTSAVTAQKNAVAALQTAKRNLELDQAGAVEEDIEAQEAQVKIAEADLESARARFQKTLVVAPFTGIVTKMDAKVGGTASSNSSAISMISAGTLEIESFVPEINAPLIKVGNDASATLDAYGEHVPFAARVISVDPAETVRDGVSTYRAILQFTERDARVKPGMTANILITTEKKENVIAVPQGVVIRRDGKVFVRLQERGVIIEREVTTGSVSSLGTVEIISGLLDGDSVLLALPEE